MWLKGSTSAIQCFLLCFYRHAATATTFFHFTAMKSEGGHRKKLMAMPKTLSRETAVVHTQWLSSPLQSKATFWQTKQWSSLASQTTVLDALAMCSQLVDTTCLSEVPGWSHIVSYCFMVKNRCTNKFTTFSSVLTLSSMFWIWPPDAKHLWAFDPTPATSCTATKSIKYFLQNSPPCFGGQPVISF